MFLDPLTQEIYFIDGGQIWDMNFNPIDFTTDDISTPHHPDGKYRSYCNDPMNDLGYGETAPPTNWPCVTTTQPGSQTTHL